LATQARLVLLWRREADDYRLSVCAAIYDLFYGYYFMIFILINIGGAGGIRPLKSLNGPV